MSTDVSAAVVALLLFLAAVAAHGIVLGGLLELVVWAVAP